MYHSVIRPALGAGLLLLLGFLAAGMGGKIPGPDEVASITKVSIRDKEIVAHNRPLIVSFSDPMVKPEDTDKPVPSQNMPFTVTPPVAGQGRWLTEKSFSFVTDSGYRRGERYFVLFRDNLRSLDGKPVRASFSFSSETTTLKGAWLHAPVAGQAELRLRLRFSLPVTAEALLSHLSVKDEADGTALECAPAAPGSESTEQDILISLDRFRPKLALHIRADAEAEDNPIGFAAPYTAALNVPAPDAPAPPATVVSEEPSSLHLQDNTWYDAYEDGLQALFYLSQPLSDQQDPARFIRVSPDIPFTVGPNNNVIFFKNLEPNTVLTVTLLPGLADSSGRVLAKERSSTLRLGNRNPSVRFAEPGNYLTPLFGGRLALSLTNVDRVSLTLQRQYDNNLPFMSLSPYSGADIARSLSYREFDLNPEKNKELRRALDLEELAGGQRGVFFLQANGYSKVVGQNGASHYEYASSDRRVIVFSDLGITSRIFPSGATIFVSSLSTGKPVAGAGVRLYSSSNQLLAEGKTNETGIFLLKRDEPWDPQLRPAVAAVNTEKDISFLPLDSPLPLPDSEGRPYLDKGYEAFLFTPRGVFRPGETVDIKALVRDPDQDPPSPFPVIFSIISSRGLEISRGSTMLSDQGGASYAFALPTSAPTGEYRATLSIPGKENDYLGRLHFGVEDFVPPRLEVSVTPARTTLTGKTPLPVALSGQYLFGSPGADLRYELGYRISPRDFSPKGWEGYVFGNLEKKTAPSFDLRLHTGSLGADGSADVSFIAPDWELAAGASLQLVGSVQEDGGRWVTRTNSLAYYPTPYLLGLKAEDPLVPGKAAAILVAAVDPEGAAVETGSLSVEISQIRGNWHTVRQGGRYVHSWSEHIRPLRSAKIATAGGRGVISFTPPAYGLFLIRCATEDGAIVAARRLRAGNEIDGAGEEGSGRMDQVILSLDKQEYLPGETARLAVKAPYAGTLFLGLERSGQIWTRVIALDRPTALVDIPVGEELRPPNAVLTAWVYRPVDDKDREWSAHRAYGSIPLLLARAPRSLTVKAETPERAEPSRPLALPFTVKDAEGNPVAGEFSVALVDEGILSLTAFSTPDPMAFFMARRRPGGTTYDGFDALLRPEARATLPLAPGGDRAQAEAYQGSLSTQQVFLAGFLPTVRTGADGRGEALFDIPEYSGKGRLMIVGAAGSSFASASYPVRFARDLTLEAAAPRAVAPGDSFDISLKAFALETCPAGSADIRLRVEEGPLILTGPAEASFTLRKPEGGPNALALTVPAKADTAVGTARLTIDVYLPGGGEPAFSKRLEVVVRPPYPRISQSLSALIPAGQKKTLSFPSTWAPGSVASSLSVAGSPVFAVLPALEYLREYPYGCLEQTVSRAWPYLTLNEVQEALSLNPQAGAEDNSRLILEGVVARVISFQTSDGGFGMWPGDASSDPWKSVNAAFFLTEAKSRAAVPAGALNNSLDYLRFILAAPEAFFDDPMLANSAKAYAAFVLTRAGDAPLAWMQHLSGLEHKMWPSGRIFLAAAKALKAGNPAALRSLKQADLQLDPQKLGYNRSLESSLRNQALLLMAWSMVAPEDAETERLCQQLAERVQSAPWLTTQSAGAASLAFGLYLGQTRIKDKAYTAVLTAAGRRIAEAAKGGSLILGKEDLPLQADGNPAPVTVEIGGEGRAYVTYALRGVPLSPPQPGNNSLHIQSSWKGTDGSVLDFPETGALLQRGDRVTVELKIRADRPVSDVVISFLLPGGLEVENPRLAAAAADPAGLDGREEEEDEEDEGGESGPGPASGSGIFMDLREDRLLLFLDGLEAGRDWTSYSFSMRAVSRGTFLVPPVAAEGMYNPEINAIGPALKLVIK